LAVLYLAAVSPFKYTEADCAYQYLKLEKKIAAGADFAITQLGFDSRKFRELKRYMDERGLKTPIFGNVYVLPPKAAERMSKGEPPGCWVSPELLAKIQEEAKAEDKGLAARLERAAKMAAIVRGLGYAGAYIGGTHNPSTFAGSSAVPKSLRRAGRNWPKRSATAPRRLLFLRLAAASAQAARIHAEAFRCHRARQHAGPCAAVLTGILRWIDKRPAAAQALEKAELAFKKPVFGCQACGNCVLGLMEYVCPMTCPKNMRNGPCGGTSTASAR
jgi:methylenetetrahydrofolate reductase (NADPH)